MILKRLTVLSLLAISLLLPGLAQAIPTGLHENPTYLSFAGELNRFKDGTAYGTGELYNAIFYIDYNRDVSTYRFPGGTFDASRSYYARYVSGNIFGDLANIEGTGEDYTPFGENGYQEGYISLTEPFGTFFNYSKTLSSIDIGDYLDYGILSDGNLTGVIVMLCNGVTESPATTPVPEPATCLLVGAGLAGLGFVRKRAKS